MALTAALQYRLSGERGFDSPTLARARSHAVSRRAGRRALRFRTPTFPIATRSPSSPGATGVAQSHVAAGLEPLAPRAPLEVWTAEDPLLVRRFVMGLAELIAETDVRELDAALAAPRSRRRGAGRYAAVCTDVGRAL